MRSHYRSKFFSLIPFFVESRVRDKSFVIKMELYPKSEYMKLYTLRLGGVYEKYVPIKSMIPINRFDYWASSWVSDLALTVRLYSSSKLLSLISK